MSTTHTAKITATGNADLTVASGFMFTIECADREASQALAATFPKALRVKASTCGTSTGTLFQVIAQQSLQGNGTTGERNETGERRVRRLLATLDRLGIAIDYRSTVAVGRFPTLEAFLATLA
jgi:hypothetical protein